MRLNPSEHLTEFRAQTRHAKIPPPAFLGRDLQCDWDIITTLYANLLLIGSSPETGAMLDALEPHFREPICRCTAKAGAALPEPTAGTLIVFGVDGLDARQQEHMLRWIHRSPPTRVQVVCTSSQSLYRLVQADDFLAELYYRLNIVLLDVIQ